MIFRNQTRLRARPKINVNGTRLQVVRHFTYLGFYMSDKNLWKKTLLERRKQAEIALKALVRCLQLLRLQQIDLKLVLFNSLIKSVLLYGSPVWSPFSVGSLEITENKFLRRIFHLPACTSACVLCKEFNVFPIEIAAKMALYKYWVSILARPNLPLLAEAYKADIANSQHDWSWSSHVKALLDQAGLSYIWLA